MIFVRIVQKSRPEMTSGLPGKRIKLATTSSTQHHKLKKKMERNLFAGSFHCVKI